jgi:hypothetical protein
VVLAGGMLTHDSSELTRLVREQLQSSFPVATIVTPKLPIEEAAALLAYRTQTDQQNQQVNDQKAHQQAQNEHAQQEAEEQQQEHSANNSKKK